MLDIGGGLSVNYSTDEAPQVTAVCLGLNARLAIIVVDC
jgi:diaminopimelate decarboxylase